MKNILLLFLASFIGMSAAFAQADEPVTDSIFYESNFGGNKFFQVYEDGYEPLGNSQLMIIMRDNQQAYQLVRKAAGNGTVASVLGFTGGVLVGIPIGSAILGGDANWTLAAVGGGIIAASIPFSISSNKKMRHAVDIYNTTVESSYRKPGEFRLVFENRGAGFSFTF